MPRDHSSHRRYIRAFPPLLWSASFHQGQRSTIRRRHGVLNTVLQMIEEGATHLGVATDHVIESFRNELWSGYKTGEGIEPALLAQFEPLEDSLAASQKPFSTSRAVLFLVRLPFRQPRTPEHEGDPIGGECVGLSLR